MGRSALSVLGGERLLPSESADDIFYVAPEGWMSLPADIRDLEDQLDKVDQDARALVAGLTAELGVWRQDPGSWSVAQCLDHLATGNRVYLQAMAEPVARARREGRQRRRPARPGFVGRLFVRWLEPPVKPRLKGKAPKAIEPRASPPLADAYASFTASQDEVRAFLRAHADLELASVRFPNPFIPGVRFSLATGLHVIPAHERRHLWQAWRVRRAGEQAVSEPPG